jgi:hypothetical protein
VAGTHGLVCGLSAVISSVDSQRNCYKLLSARSQPLNSTFISYKQCDVADARFVLRVFSLVFFV